MIVGSATVRSHEWGSYITIEMDGKKDGLRNGGSQRFSIDPKDGWEIEVIGS